MVDLEILEFNKAYIFKYNPTDPRRVYMYAKQNQGINVSLPKNKKNWK